jgi:hypothetical protein
MARRDLKGSFDSVLAALKLNFNCARCGGRAAMTTRMIWLYRGDPDPSRCSDCGLLLDSDGRPAGYAGANGKPVVHVIDLRGNYAWADQRPHDPGARIENCIRGTTFESEPRIPGRSEGLRR